MKSVSLREWLPIMGVEDGCIISKRGDLTFGWLVYPPVIYTVSEGGYDSIIRSVAQATKLLPLYTIVHKQDVFCYDSFGSRKSPYFLRQAYYDHFAGRRYLNNYSYIYVTFSTKANVESKSMDSTFFSGAVSRMPDADRIRQCADIADTFESVLRSNGLLVLKRLGSDDLLGVDDHGQDKGSIADYLRLFDRTQPDFNLRMMNERGEYGDNRICFWYVEDSDSYPDMVSSAKLVPGMSSRSSSVFLSGGSPIGIELRIPHVVNRYMVVIPKDGIMKDFDQKKRLNTSMSGVSSESEVNARELTEYLQDAANNSFVTVKTFMNVMAWGHKSLIPEIRNKIVTAFRSEMDMSVCEDTMTVPLLHYAAVPGAESNLGFENYLNSEKTSFLCHGLWDGYDFGKDGQIIHMCDRNAMIPVTTDIQTQARLEGRINNMNMMVIGPSGSGKSFTTNSLVQDFYEAQEHIMIVDIGNSYKGLCSVINEESGGKDGIYYTYDPANPFGFNPFKGHLHWNDVDNDGEQVNNGLDFLLSVLMTLYKPVGGWSSDASSALKFFIRQFLDWWDNGVPREVNDDIQGAYINERRRRTIRNGFDFDPDTALEGFIDPVPEVFPDDRRGTDPIFDNFYLFVTRIVSPLMRDDNYVMENIHLSEKIIDVDRFGIAMDMYKLDGVYGFLLNSRDQADLFQSRFTVFEVDLIKNNPDLFPIWTICIMHSFEEKMRGLECQKVMIIEEAWKSLTDETMKDYIEWLWRTARKFRTSAVVVTQDINDLVAGGSEKNPIIMNTDVKILLDQRSNANNFESLVRYLGLNELDVTQLLSVNTSLDSRFRYKECFIATGPSYSNVYAVEVSPEQAICFETDNTRKAPLLKLAKEKGSWIQAIRILADEMKKR